MYKKLFTPGKIGNVEIKNRLVMSPMGTNISGLDGAPTDEMIEFYEARAIGGVGLIYTEVCRVNEVHGAAMLRQLSLTSDRNIEPMSKLTSAIHNHGTKIFCQLHHPGRETARVLLGGAPVVAPSAIMCKFTKEETRALEHSEVLELVQQFIAAAVRAKKAGFDGVELHAAHGYLLNQFLSPYTNKRTDEYGGSFENRMRFITEIITGIHKTCGDDYPVTVRLSVDEFLDKTGVTEDYIHAKDGVQIAMYLEKVGAAAINVSCGIYETGVSIIEPVTYPQGWRTPFVKAVKDHVSIPVIAVSAIREPAFAEKLLEDGVQDFISMGRGWLADENWGTKAMEGRDKEIRKCIGCLNCFDSLKNNMPVGMPPDCAVNPRLCKEKWFPTPAYDYAHHSIAVIGAGPAGMAAARTAAERGMKVTLIEKSGRLGGLVNYASASPLKGNMHWIVDYYTEEFDRLGVNVMLNTEATVPMLEEMNPDAIIVATGAKPIFPEKIPGVNGKNVFGIYDVLDGVSGLENKKVLIAGAGITGLECGEYLAAKNCELTIADMLDAVAPNDIQTIVLDDCMRLQQHGAKFMLKHALKEIKPDGVVLTNMDTKENVTIPCDAVVLSLGLTSVNELTPLLHEKFKNVCEIGSAAEVGRVPAATRDGFRCAYDLFAKKDAPSFFLPKEKMESFGKMSLMDGQEGLYVAYLTDPAAIRKVLPPVLKPFAMPVVTVSVCHVNKPSFADDYYEAILGVYAMYGTQLGLYPLGLVLGGPGSEMACFAGRDNASMPKKTGAEFVIRRDENNVTVGVTRRGTQLVDATLKIGAYNCPLAHAIYQAPAAGKQVYGGGFYCHFDRIPDDDGTPRFVNTGLLTNLVEYNYKTWEPGFAGLSLSSSIDDPWGELPINTIIGGAYSENSIMVHKVKYLQPLDPDEVMPYLLTGYYDRTMFMETGRK